MSYHVGDRWQEPFEVTDPVTKERVEPTSVSMLITKPDTSTYTGSAVREDEGLFHLDEDLDEAGKWRAAVDTTGKYQAAKPKSITVYPN